MYVERVREDAGRNDLLAHLGLRLAFMAVLCACGSNGHNGNGWHGYHEMYDASVPRAGVPGNGPRVRGT